MTFDEARTATANSLAGFTAVYRRELQTYFTTPMAYVFMAVFLLAVGVFTWEAGNFFDSGRADLAPFFLWHPWLYMIFMPALAMRLWSDERARGTAELLFSLPVGLPGLAVGKLLAAWTVAAAALVLTLPMWFTVNYLGDADNISIALTYCISLLMAGAYISLGLALSALTKNQVTAFVLSVFVAFLFTAAGWPVVLSGLADLFGARTADSLARLSFLSHFEAAQRGVLEGRAILFFLSVIALWTALSVLWSGRSRG
ncbi:MAG: ABC transporter permease subunit [Pseudomonadota bacterium]